VYKTAHHERFVMDYKCTAVEVALATAAAPTYFPAYQAQSGVPLVDGGMWANNPVGPAVVEVIGVLGWQPHELRVLSLGCTAEAYTGRPRNLERVGLRHWLYHLASTFMAGQSSASLGTAQLLAGHDRVIRICPTVPAGRFQLDKVQASDGLRGLGYAEARKAMPCLAEFFVELAEQFIPYHTLPTSAIKRNGE
jgi:predicted acylesterase/phospholipase RssA